MSSGTGLEASTTPPRRAEVVIVYGDPVVGQNLNLSLQTESYDTRLAAGYSLEDPAQRARLLHGTRLLLLAPGLIPGRRDRLLTLLREEPDTKDIYIVELGDPPGGALGAVDHSVPWPSRTEELRRWIQAALSAPGPPGTGQ